MSVLFYRLPTVCFLGKRLLNIAEINCLRGGAYLSFKAFLACLVCKAVRFALLLCNKGGTSFPGRIALRICPDILSRLSAGFKVVAVTGTNGKTTSCHMLETEFREAGHTVFSNRSGANLPDGITTEFITHSTLTGKPKTEWAIVECDEAAAAHVFGQLKPEIVLVTNLFRDQLDRYGEISHVRSFIINGLAEAPDARLCLNADDPLTASIAEQTANETVFYGFEKSAASPGAEPPDLSDASHCIRCKTKYDYSYITYSHLGGFHCPNCGYERKTPYVQVKSILSQSTDRSEILLSVDGRDYTAELRLPTIYNVYNAAGAVAAMTAAGVKAEVSVGAVSKFRSAFGRMEKLTVGDSQCKMILVKNPSAFNQALEYLLTIDGSFSVVVGLNDFSADGRDISWIWDINMELLHRLEHRLEQVIVFGSRYADMALRLKYAGISEDKLVLVSGCDCKRVEELIRKHGGSVYILPTYTAMLRLRRRLVSARGTGFWG